MPAAGSRSISTANSTGSPSPPTIHRSPPARTMGRTPR